MSAEFDMKGLAELEKDLRKCITDYPDQTDRAMRRWANQGVRECNAKMPASYTEGKRPFLKSWRKTMSRELGVAAEIQIVNKSPHFHLVENGHEKVVYGKRTGGFVPGKHFAEKTREEWKDTFPEEVKKFMDEMLRGGNL